MRTANKLPAAAAQPAHGQTAVVALAPTLPVARAGKVDRLIRPGQVERGDED